MVFVTIITRASLSQHQDDTMPVLPSRDLLRPPGQCGPSPRGVGNETAFHDFGMSDKHFRVCFLRTFQRCEQKMKSGVLQHFSRA